MQAARRIRRMLRRHAVTRPIEKEYFSEAREAANIMSTVATKLLPFANIAAELGNRRDDFLARRLGEEQLDSRPWKLRDEPFCH